jgi:hypothetical protein
MRADSPRRSPAGSLALLVTCLLGAVVPIACGSVDDHQAGTSAGATDGQGAANGGNGSMGTGGEDGGSTTTASTGTDDGEKTNNYAYFGASLSGYVDFGAVIVGSSLTKAIGVKNLDVSTRTIVDVAVTSAPTFTIIGGTCRVGLELASRGTCDVVVRFAPTEPGEHNATLAISATSDSATATLQGRGGPPSENLPTEPDHPDPSPPATTAGGASSTAEDEPVGSGP